MIKVSLIGSGNLAQHLIAAFQNAAALGAEIELVQVYSRQREPLAALLPFECITTDLATLVPADVYIIAVSDDAIAEVSDQLPFKNCLVVHTSGSLPLEALNENNRKGVFYPLQTFSKNKPIAFSGIPLCLETQNPTDFQLLQKVAQAISNSVFAINSEQRKALHVAAVFVNNFVNHLYQIGHDICAEHQVPFDILKPLMLETAEKITRLSPKEAQTGPAKRGDSATIASHIALLNNENQKAIYKLLTQSIQDHE